MLAIAVVKEAARAVGDLWLLTAFPVLQCAGLLCLDLFSGFTGFSLFGGGIAHFAHIGGAIIGFLMMLVWRKNHQRTERITVSDY